jgi:hypothetical protein
MKCLSLAILTLFNFFHPEILNANEESVFDIDQYLNYEFTGTDDYLEFAINLSNDLNFDKRYLTYNLPNGQGCEITCLPTEEYQTNHSNSHIEKINLTVEATNPENPNRVQFTIITKASLIKQNEANQSVTKTTTVTSKTTISNPNILLTNPPKFFFHKETPQLGSIIYENSFPYSQLEN